jgi:Viral BACON domain/Fibronectin type III domain
LLLIVSASGVWLNFWHMNIREFNMIEGAVMNQRVAKRYRKGYVLRFGLLSLMGVVSFVVFSYASVAHAVQVTLAWDPPATGTLDGYRVFYRLQNESYDYSNPDWQGSTNTCTISSLQDTTTFFVVRAYNAAGESPDSNEATYQPVATSTPAISLSPASLSTSCTQGSNASQQSFQVANSASGTLSYSISTGGASWLSCNPASGSSTGESDTITVSYNTSGNSAGTYFATITIASAAASNSPQTIPVRLTVNAPSSPAGTSTASSSPVISLSPASLSTSCNQGWSASKQSFQVSNSGGGTLSYSITDDASWLSCSPTSGSGSGTITVSYNTSKLAVGTYSATITIGAAGAGNSPQTIPVKLTVSQPSGHGRWGRWH